MNTVIINNKIVWPGLFFILFLYMAAVYADPFNPDTDKGLVCTLTVADVGWLYANKHNEYNQDGSVAWFYSDKNVIMVTNKMLEKSVTLNYSHDNGTFTMSSFGPVAKSPHSRFIPVTIKDQTKDGKDIEYKVPNLSEFSSDTDPAILDELAVTKQIAKKFPPYFRPIDNKMIFWFAYNFADDTWRIFG
ncbi:MAG TPA: hypothetical protein VKR58_04615, partial [Aquella sp.]|nr:hypothetical protein [Aquella sp.]